MAEELLKAVRDLTDAVGRLQAELHQYPKRQEVAERYATKEESRARGFKYLAIGLAFVLVSFLASIVVTTVTITTCFISAEARAGAAVQACNWLPGYQDAQAENKQLLEDFRDLLTRPERNAKRLDRIEKELGLPPLYKP